MPTPFPDPRTLFTGLLNLERALSTFEDGRAALTFARSSSDSKVTLTVNGLGAVVSVFIDDSQLALPLATLAEKVRAAANAAIDAATAATAATIPAFANGLSLPALPAQGATPPDYPEFVLLADTITAQILANNPCQSTELFECRAGRVVAVVDAHRRCTSLTYELPAPRTTRYLEARTLEALNCAIRKGTGRKKDTDDATGGITDSFTLQQLCLYAKGQLKLNDRVKVKSLNCQGWATVGNAGMVETYTGSGTELGNIVSRVRVVVSGSIVHGFIHTSDVVVPQNQPQITGPVEEHAVVVLPDLTLSVPFPGVTQGTIELEPNQQQTASPGYYNKLVVKTGAQANLSSGTYYFNDFDLEPGGKVKLTANAGPIVFWVRYSFIFRGSFFDSAGGFPRVFAGYLGTSTAFVESSYKGTLSAPSAKIAIQTVQNHEGAFHAKDLEVQPDIQICHHPFELRYDQLPGTVPPGGLPPPTVDLGFEDVSGWSSPQSVLTSVQSPVSQGARSLQISNVTGLTEIVSANFSADLAPQGATRAIVDLWVPTNQPNPTSVGSASLIISAPSANVNAVNLGSLGLTSLTRGQFSQLEYPLTTAVRNALDTTRNDVSVKIALAINSGSGPWFIDNVRFLLPPPALSTLDPILSFEDQTKWSSAQATLSTSTTLKTHLTKSLRIATAPGWTQVISVPFSSGALSAPTGKFRIDLYKPSNQPNPSWHGQFQLFIDVPSAGISNVATSTVELTPLQANVFSTLELALPSNVKTAINGEYADVKLKLTLNVVANSGPWHLDNIRFV